MMPIVLVSSSKKATSSFIKKMVDEHKISPYYIYEISPALKEFTIGQIRDIKKNIIYHVSAVQLYILYDFDTASLEAQNAFLKTLEEHQEKIQFVLVVKNSYKLLPTIRSRSRLIQLKSSSFSLEEDFEKELTSYLKSLNLKIFVHKKFQTKGMENPSTVFLNLIYFFKEKLASDPMSTSVLREILSMKYLVENNHADAQAAVDHILLFIRKLYSNA